MSTCEPAGVNSTAGVPQLHQALDDTEFGAGGLSLASGIQAVMRFWMHGHKTLMDGR